MKRIIAVILAISCLAILGGCASSGSESSTPASSSQTDTTQASDTPSETAAASASSEYIGEVAAKTIALEHAKLTESEVAYVNVMLDYDDGRTVYDIEFYVGTSEYDYEIDAYTGDILSYDYDIDNYTFPTAQNDGSTYISPDEAKTIALNKAGLTEEQVTYTKSLFEYDDGIAVYQIDFICDGMEHGVEINAVDGVVIEYDVGSQYD